MSQNLERKIEDSPVLDILLDYTYDESIVFAYEAFLRQNTFTERNVWRMKCLAQKIMGMFPNLEDLNKWIAKKGIVETSRSITAAEISKVSGFFYFLAMVRLLDVFSFSDFYRINPKTVNRLEKWFEPYIESFGVKEFSQKVVDVASRVRNRDPNLDVCRKLSNKCCLYLILRYQLKHISKLTVSEWMEFRLEVHSLPVDAHHFACPTYMQQAFFEMGIFQERLPNTVDLRRNKSYTKEYAYDCMPNIKPATDMYKEYCISKFSMGTNQHKFHDLETFFKYIIDRYGKNFALSDLNRAIIRDYLNGVLTLGRSDSFNQGKAYALKNFMEFVIANAHELYTKGVPVNENNNFVKNDFHVKATTRFPRPIEKKILDALFDALTEEPDIKFKLVLLIMLYTGLPARETMHLTRDCIKAIGEDQYELFYYREKTKKYKITKVEKIVYDLILRAKKLNTQVKKMPHPDGRNEFFLFNDGGIPLEDIWFSGRFRRLRGNAIALHPDLKEELSRVVSYRIRHTFATTMRERGADVYTISRLMGHENINTTKIYAKENDQRKIELVEMLNQKYICEGAPDLKSAISGAAGDELAANMMDIRNHMNIGICIVNGYENCPNAFKCLDCIYLCSTKKDIPEMVMTLKSLKQTYESTGNQTERGKIQKQIKTLCRKIELLRQPDLPAQCENDDGADALKFI
ncbi:tyrosine-type recombinase/integrase [Selenomonas montiformis]|uniref:tyrosine-type recombinase/integrase n=3 Tax=Selenomonas montiformis TaxID=2652285 RepID=UPI002A86D492|nr:site-specific integrase [Selenomonas montiformis]